MKSAAVRHNMTLWQIFRYNVEHDKICFRPALKSRLQRDMSEMCQNRRVPNKKYLPRHTCQHDDIICYVLLFFVNEIVIRKHEVITDAQLFKKTYHLRH